MKIPTFQENELKVVEMVPGLFGNPDAPVFDYPISAREAVRMMYKGKAPWVIGSCMDVETVTFAPYVNPDNIARAFVLDGTFIPGVSNTEGGKDMFGIEWMYVAEAGVSMVKPGNPFAEDMEDLLEKIVWPDVDSWDWEGCRKKNEAYLSQSGKSYCTWFMNGYFERLISFLDFENAIVALIDEDEMAFVHKFFDKLADLYIKIFGKMIQWFPEVDVYYIHDDWGSQRASFFSPDVAKEMIVPYMRRVNDFLHENGKYSHFHSCGHLMNMVDNIIEAGWDAWDPQPMNDTVELYEKYGDRIQIGVYPECGDLAALSEEEQRIEAHKFVEKYCRLDRRVMVNMYAVSAFPTAFREQLYKESRMAYAEK